MKALVTKGEQKAARGESKWSRQRKHRRKREENDKDAMVENSNKKYNKGKQAVIYGGRREAKQTAHDRGE